MYSRRQAEKIIMDGRVKVNYELVTTVTHRIGENDKVFLDDVELRSDYQVDRPRLWLVIICNFFLYCIFIPLFHLSYL